MTSFRLPKICTIWMISYLRFVCFLVQPDGSIEDLKDNLFCLGQKTFIFRTSDISALGKYVLKKASLKNTGKTQYSF